jgi:BirA family transcriptional regulator, biotin operon repressor / biotin---[acetyl-CoA-carboxylase] ligase
MTEQDVRKTLAADVSLRIMDSVTSTNTFAREWAQNGAPHGATVIANSQDGGRGRLGRSFFSPEGGLYMSCFLHAADGQALLLTGMAAVAVCCAAERLTGVRLCIKWVNDILLDGRKVCGILTEGVMAQARIVGAVVGIGMNVRPTVFPQEITDTAGCLFTGEPTVSNAEIAAEIISELLQGCKGLERREHMPEYRRRCGTLTREIRYCQNGVWHRGKALDVNDDGGLVVETSEGITVLSTGEVTVR